VRAPEPGGPSYLRPAQIYASAIRSTVFTVRVIECALRQQTLNFATTALPPHTARRAG